MDAAQKPQYTVLARRFRPQTFDDVVGQGHVGQSLRNAIQSGRVAHAYLFTGARGVGKTSTARIFAKALNCPNVKAGVPCNACDVCASIGEGNDVDVLEIDGASNRGIDDIRSLRANVNVRSMRSPYKVYIIDEVHMLTKEAFNALLKTLEEPPPKVKFVFCTTEPNKVPDTILSRCQRFDFGTIATSNIAERLQQIADAEGMSVDPAAIDLVARRAAGSMRDSQSLFDQLLAFGEDRINTDDVHRLLGTASDDRLIELLDAVIDRQCDVAISLLDQYLSEGVQVGSFADQLLHYLRDLLMVAVSRDVAAGAGVALLSVSESSRADLQRQAAAWGVQTISAAMQLLIDTKGRMFRVNYGRVLLELAIVRMASLAELDSIADLLATIKAGKLPSAAVPTPSATGIAGTAHTSGTRGLGREATSKKNGEARATADGSPPSAPVAASTPDATSATQTAPPVETHIPLTAENTDLFWSQLLERLPDRLADHLSKSQSTAITGPNSVKCVFPQSREFSRNYCDRRESMELITHAAKELTGQAVTIQFETVNTGIPKTAADNGHSQTKETTHLRPSDVDDDEFVQQAVAVFQGTVVDVRRVRTSPDR